LGGWFENEIAAAPKFGKDLEKKPEEQREGELLLWGQGAGWVGGE